MKNNQGNLAQRAREWFDAVSHDGKTEQLTDHRSCESGHHRLENREVWCIRADVVFTASQCADWSDLQSLVVVRSQRRLWNKTTLDTRFFLSSLATSAKDFASKIPAHWGVENSLHWCLDVVFTDDRSPIRQGNAPRNFSVLRRLALNLRRQGSSKLSWKRKRYLAGLDHQFMLQILDAAVSPSSATWYASSDRLMSLTISIF